MNRLTLFWAALALMFGTGCTHKIIIRTIEPEQGVELVETPFYPQEKYQCGPASLAMILSSSGIPVHPDEIARLTYLPGRQGSLQVEMVSACRKYGRIPYQISPDLNELISEIQSGRPVLVLQNQGFKFLPVYHYAVVIGVLPDNRIVLRSGMDSRVEMKAAHFYLTWERAGLWGLVVLRPGDLPEKADPLRYLNAVAAIQNALQVAERIDSPLLESVRQTAREIKSALQENGHDAMPVNSTQDPMKN